MFTFSGIKNSRFCLTDVDLAAWNAHLEKIADFLLPGELVWWHTEGDDVVLHDGDDEPNYTRPELNFQSSRSKVAEAWKACIAQQVQIPTGVYSYFSVNGTLKNKVIS